MPRIADYAVISGGSVTLPKPGGDIDHDFTPPFNAPAVAGLSTVLTFRVRPSGGDVSMRMELNGTAVSTVNFDAGPNRAWQEVVAGGVLQASNNTLRLIRTGGPGSVTVSDLVMHFQADI